MSMNINWKDLSTKGKIWAIVAILIVIGAIVAFVLTMHFSSVSAPKHTVENNVYKISGSFGAEIDLSGAEIILIEDGSMLNITYRNNGSSAKGVAKGKFTLTENAVGRIVYLNMMDIDAITYIKIKDKDGAEYYICRTTQVETKALYDELIKHTAIA